MTMLKRTLLICNDEVHHISVWEPGDEELCGVEHIIYGTNGHIICCENHDIDLDKTVTDLTGESPVCLTFIEKCDTLTMINALVRHDNSLAEITLYITDTIHKDDADTLRWASRYGDGDITKFLLEHGVKTDYPDDNVDGSALEQAVQCGHLPIVKCLVEHGANIHINNDGALSWAKRHGPQSIIDYLEKKLAEEQRGTP